MITLQKGAVYQSRHNGMVEYIGLDRFWGEYTHQFRRLAVGDMTYIQPEQLDEFLAPQETLETVKQQLAEAQQERQKEHDLRVRLAGELENANARLEAAEKEISSMLSGITISIPTDTMEQEIASQVRLSTAKLKARSDALLSALHGVADILDELSQEQSASSLQGGAAGAASGIRLSIIKILGGAS